MSIKKIKQYIHKTRMSPWLIFFFLVYIVLIIKYVTIREYNNDIFFATYSVAVSFFILSRFVFAYFYDPHENHFDKQYRPTITIGIPSMNEEAVIEKTIMSIANSDYPKNKFEIIAVNDGSTDDTLGAMRRAQEKANKIGVKVRVFDFKVNQGKREGMAKCISESKCEIIVFIDSDSFVKENTIYEMAKYFSNKDIAAVSGHAYVSNPNVNMLTKMQAARYFVAFKAYKGTESLFGSVSCCSGCCSAYRVSQLQDILAEWTAQTFLGVKCTYGDDRSLTNFLLKRGHKAMFSPTALSYTEVPTNYRKFMKQQLRWKKSWIRESLIASLFIWKRHLVASISFYLSIILTVLAPFIVLRALIWYPLTTGRPPFFYVFGLLIMAAIYGLYYYIYTKDKNWFYGVIFALFYTFVMIWQLPYAILTLRDNRWGTR